MKNSKEIDIREKRHREEMRNLDKNLEGKSTAEAMEILDGMEERAQELIGCIDDRIGGLNGELDDLEQESEKIDRDCARAIRWTIVITGIAIGVVIIAAVKGWIA